MTKTITISYESYLKLNDVRARLRRSVRKGKVTYSMAIMTSVAAYEEQFKEEETN